MKKGYKRKQQSLFQRSGSPYWWIRRFVSHPDVCEIRISTRTTDEKVARRYDDLIVDYRDRGNFEPLIALKQKKVTLYDLHTNRDAGRLSKLIEERSSPLVKPLLDEWFEYGARTSSIRESSMRRYRTSWTMIEELGMLTGKLRLRNIDQMFVHRFKILRTETRVGRARAISNATVNRDLAAIGSFMNWCKKSKGIEVVLPASNYFRESKGKDRWLNRDEVAAFQQHCEPEWWCLFALLFSTGMTIGEAIGLRLCDVDFTAKRLSIHEEGGRSLKRASRARELAIAENVIPLLRQQTQRIGCRPEERIFPVTYSPARKAWLRTCKAAGIVGATLHDTRHTFAVHAVQQGVPEARLQKLLGHSHAGTTRRYATHATEQFVDQDAERVAKSVGI